MEWTALLTEMSEDGATSDMFPCITANNYSDIVLAIQLLFICIGINIFGTMRSAN